MAFCGKTAIVNGKHSNVYTVDQFVSDKDFVVSDESAVVEINNGDQSVMLPIRTNVTMDRPGLYVGQGVHFVRFPETAEERTEYIPSEDRIVDYSKIKNMQTLLDKKEQQNKAVNQYVETDINGGNIFKPKLMEEDSAEMRGLKHCILQKHIELEKYAERFGANFPNDKRKLRDTEITSYLLKRMCNNLDLEVDIVFRDRSSDVPNPMNKTVTINMIPGINNSVIIDDV